MSEKLFFFSPSSIVCRQLATVGHNIIYLGCQCCQLYMFDGLEMTDRVNKELLTRQWMTLPLLSLFWFFRTQFTDFFWRKLTIKSVLSWQHCRLSGIACLPYSRPELMCIHPTRSWMPLERPPWGQVRSYQLFMALLFLKFSSHLTLFCFI